MIPGPELEGKYEILRKIREGGMGAVYEVRHRLLDERRVIKVIHPHLVSSQELAERFRFEARAASGLRHPNIAHLHDFSVDADGRAYIIMELIEGLGLDEIVRTQGPPPLGLGLEISRQSLRAIGFLHRRGFLHRDVSPDNLMLTRDPEGAPLVKLIDLGIAKVLVESGGGLTMAGTFLGKPRYASPEQLGAGDEIDGRSDLYSLGVVIYELLTGVCPIQGDNPSALLASHLFQPPLDFSVSDPGGKLPADLRDFLLQALAKKPEERFASAEEMGRRLVEIQDRFPCTLEDLDAVLARPERYDLDATAVLPRRGSTQERLDRQFAKEATPGGTVPAASVVPLAAAAAVEPKAATPAPALPTQRLESRPPARTERIPTVPPAPLPPSAPMAPPPQPVEEPVLARAPAWAPPPKEREKRKGLGWIAAALAVVALAVLAALFLREDDPKAVRPAEVAEKPAEAPVREPVPAPSPSQKQPEPPPPPPIIVESAEPAVVPEAPPARNDVAEVRPEPERKAPPPSVEKPKPVEPKVASPETATDRKQEEEKKKEKEKPAPPVTVPVPEGRRPDTKVEDEEEISFVDPPRQLLMPSATYPREAAGSGATARVVVAILVNEKGEVAEARVSSMTIEEGGSGPKGEDLKELFREAAVEAARKARFHPATSDGVPVSYRGELNFKF